MGTAARVGRRRSRRGRGGGGRTQCPRQLSGARRDGREGGKAVRAFPPDTALPPPGGSREVRPAGAAGAPVHTPTEFRRPSLLLHSGHWSAPGAWSEGGRVEPGVGGAEGPHHVSLSPRRAAPTGGQRGLPPSLGPVGPPGTPSPAFRPGWGVRVLWAGPSRLGVTGQAAQGVGGEGVCGGEQGRKVQCGMGAASGGVRGLGPCPRSPATEGLQSPQLCPREGTGGCLCQTEPDWTPGGPGLGLAQAAGACSGGCRVGGNPVRTQGSGPGPCPSLSSQRHLPAHGDFRSCLLGGTSLCGQSPRQVAEPRW